MAVVLLVTYLCGGYVAGRMARRAGLLNGLAVFLLAVVLVALVAAVAASQTDAEAIGEGDTGATRLTSPPPRRPRPNGSAVTPRPLAATSGDPRPLLSCLPGDEFEGTPR
jgi:hypothetical protein